MIDRGDALPSATFLDADEAELALSDFTSQPLIVYFYPKADTPGCTIEAQDFTRLTDDFAAKGVRIIAVSRDSPARLSKFRSKYDLSICLASDADGALCEAFGTWVKKQNYGRSYMGIERSTFWFDAEGKCVRVWRKVRAKGHAQAVFDAMA